jgi:hypothetical protein
MSEAAAGGTAAPAWIADLPEDLRSNPTIASFKGNDWKEVGPVIAKSYVEARSVMGKKAYDLPQDDWKPEQWQSWHKTIGVPEGPDKYPAIDNALAEKAGLSKEVLGAALAKFHEAGMTPRQVKAILNDWYVTESAKGADMQAEQRKQETAQALQALKTEYGDKYEAKAGLIRSVLNLGGPELAQRLEAAGYGNDPQLFKALATLGEKILEDSSAKGGKAGMALGPEADRAAALKEIDEIKAARINDPSVDAKYNDPRSAERNRWNDLHQKAFPKAA